MPSESHFFPRHHLIYQRMYGIVTPEDAVEFLLAGATAVQVGTASYADPRATERLAKGLESWCKGHHVDRVSSLTGALELPQ